MTLVTPRAMGAPRTRSRRVLTPLLVLLAVLVGGAAQAQTGTLSGVVIDGEFGESLPGANVAVLTPDAGTLVTGAATDLDGGYRLTVPPGTYDVTFSYTGYAVQRVTDVVITAGETTELGVTLQTNVVELEGEVVVSATAILDNDVALLRQRQRAAGVSDAVGAREISRSGAGNAADAVERVTGASVQGGRYVYVRGLGDRYATTQLNGADVPTADPDRRAVQFDLFPSDFLENITTLKTFTPDRPGNFSGGLVDITTRSFPERFQVSASLSSGFSTQTAPGTELLTDPVAGVGLFGGGGGGLGLPDGLTLESGVVPRASEVLFDPSGAAELDRLTRYFTERQVAPRAEEAPPNYGFGFSLGNRVRLLGNDLGFIVGLTADRGVTAYSNGTVGRFDVTPQDGGALLPDLRQLRLDQRTAYESSLGGLANFTYRLGRLHEVGLNTLFSRSAESEARYITGLAPRPIGSAGDSILVVDRVLGYTERQLASGQLTGRHQMPALAGLNAEWRLNYSVTDLSEPDRRYFANSILRDEDNNLIYGTGGGSLDNALHYYRDLDEDLGSAGLDLTLPPRALAGLPVQIKVGGLYQRSTREFRERRLEVQYDQSILLGGVDPDSVAAFFGPAYSGITRVDTLADGRVRYRFGHQLVDTTLPSNLYDGTLDVGAAYAMAEFPLFPRFRVIGGARLERTDLRVESQQVDSLIIVGSDTTQVFLGGGFVQTDVLPSLNLVYGLTDAMNLRAAATRTLARPTFREIAPFSSFDFATDAPLIGNPELQRTLITNLDLRWEWFNTPGAILAVSGYYKYLESPIERVIRDFENGTTEYRNVEEAVIYGAEIEARQRLTALGRLTGVGLLGRLTLGGNISLTRSRITIDPEELTQRRLINPDAPATRPLQGQSPYLINLDLAYEDANGTAVGLYFNVAGERLSRVGAGAVDIFERPSPQLDLVGSRQFLGQVTVRLAVRNILGRGMREVYGFEQFPTGSAFAFDEAVYQAYERGPSYSIGLSFSPRYGGAGPVIPPAEGVGVPVGAGNTPD